MKFIGIIPARYASSRFPGKPLALLAGKPVIEHVYENVAAVLNDVAVATDNVRIADTVRAFGGNVVMTRADHRSGTDRICEAYNNLGCDHDIVVNIQGDEPFVSSLELKAIMACFNDENTQIATLVKPFDRNGDVNELMNPNKVKVVVGADDFALYFSRSIIPYLRGVDCARWPQEHQFYTHLGMYAFRADALQQVTQLPQSALEIAESLEQLRWLENGYRIKVGYSNRATIGIDTPEDLANAEAFLAQNKL